MRVMKIYGEYMELRIIFNCKVIAKRELLRFPDTNLLHTHGIHGNVCF
jgi:hypothetical protein